MPYINIDMIVNINLKKSTSWYLMIFKGEGTMS